MNKVVATGRRGVNPWVLLAACAVFACCQISWAGYQLGVGNQSIQVSFLHALYDPARFARDVMVQATLEHYPSYFYRLLSRLLWLADVPTLYLTLHILAGVATIFVIALLSRAMFRDHGAALAALVVLLGGHHLALAGEALYSPGFTHTWAVFPAALLVLVLVYRQRYAWAFLIAGLVANFHALEAGYVAFAAGVVVLWRLRRLGILRPIGYFALFALAAAPTLRQMAVKSGAEFDEFWLQMTHIRSADHSFPSAWWEPGLPDVPRFACIVALAAVAMGFRMKADRRRTTLLIGAAVGVLFAAGYLLTEVWPTALGIRAQFFRSSRFLLVIALVLIARGCVAGWRLPFGRSVWWRWPLHLLEFVAATLTFAALAVPTLIVLLPWALAVSTVAAWLSGRLAWWHAALSGAARLYARTLSSAEQKGSNGRDSYRRGGVGRPCRRDVATAATARAGLSHHSALRSDRCVAFAGARPVVAAGWGGVLSPHG